ncbi:MAG: caspase family protein, partial [Planctomycetota bacterium]
MFTSTQKIAQRLLPVLAVLLAGTTTQAEDRYALVIGNSEYAEQPLKNPINDARVMKEKLEALDFDVTMKLDLDRKQMRAAMRQFNRRLPTDSIACVFFAGHGMRVDNRNYLVPIGSSFTEVWELEDETITEDYIRKMIQASRSRVNILILDCCLNNPFQDRAWRGRSAVTPLDFIHSPSIEGTATIYSTANGKRAEDGEGQNSPFTDALARALTLRPEGGLKLDDALKVVDRIMVTERGRDQKPHVTFDLSVMDFQLYVT